MNTKLLYIATTAIALLVTKFVVVDMLSGVKSPHFFAVIEITSVDGDNVSHSKSKNRISSSYGEPNEERWNVKYTLTGLQKLVTVYMECPLYFKEVTVVYENSPPDDTFPLVNNTRSCYFIHDLDLSMEILTDSTTCTFTLKLNPQK